MKKILYFFILIPFINFAQLPGENTFGANQVIRVDINFTQTGFWDSLVMNYPLEKDMMAANIQITDNSGVTNLDSVAIRLKGNSSYGHPGNKKSFKIDINQWVTGQDYDGLKKLNFNNGFKDPSFMREKVFFDLCKTLAIPAPRINYANVYMNGTFWGFYTYVEQIDDQFLDWAILDDQGNLFKAGDNTAGSTPADLMNYGTDQTSYYNRYELKSNENTNDWSDLLTLISFISSSSDLEFENGLNAQMNQTKLIQSLALDNLFSSLDSYLNSARNYYLYHNLTTGQWEWIKWDGNESFGLYTGGPGLGSLESLAPNYSATNRPLLSKIFANSNLYALYKDEMCNIMTNYFNSTYMNTKIDEIKSLIQTHVSNDNLKMYTTQNFIDNVEENVSVSGGPMGSQTVFGLKSFVANRSNYLSDIISCQVGVEVLDETKLKVYPNPFTSEFILDYEYNNFNILDLSGREIDFQVRDLGSSKAITFNASKGIYFVKLQTVNGSKSITVIKD
jgi:spore coat protein CotH